MNELQYCVYILLSLKDKKLYIGYTADLKRRMTEHSGGKNISTKNRRPFLLIFCEHYYFKEDAKRRELYFKTSPGKKALKLMLTKTLRELSHQ